MTAPRIEANKKAAVSQAMTAVLPAYDNDPTAESRVFTSAEGWDVTFFAARVKGEIVGYAAKVDNPDEGFSGAISLMVGLAPDGSVGVLAGGGKTNSAVIVTAQSETPGLGTAITDRKVQKTIVEVIKGAEPIEGLVPNRYLDWYAGKTADAARWDLVKDGESVNGKTGATITSQAVGGAIHAISHTAVEHLDELSKGAE